MSIDRPEGLAHKIVAALDRLERAQRAARQSVATSQQLTPLQLDLLEVLGRGTPPIPSVGELAREVAVSQPTTTDSVKSLVAKGLVRRARDPDDARRAILNVTPDGVKVSERSVEADAPLIPAVESLPAEAQAVLLETLLTLIASMVHSGAIDVARTCLTCRYHEATDDRHRCTLLNVDLPIPELRVNCPDHQAA